MRTVTTVCDGCGRQEGDDEEFTQVATCWPTREYDLCQQCHRKVQSAVKETIRSIRMGSKDPIARPA